MIINSDLCTGCMACANSCAKKAISVECDSEGFYVPKVDEDKCVNCGICDKVCPINSKPSGEHGYCQKYFWVKLKDREKRFLSQSGGMGQALYDYALSNDGVVYGAGFDDDWNVIHKRVDKKSEVRELYCSKYVQSDFSKVYENVENDLRNPIVRSVLVVGTPCQIAGLKKWVINKRMDSEKLITVDLICHGVPSPGFWKDYLTNLKKKGKISKVVFRDKTFGWSSHVETYKIGHSLIHTKKFTKLFYFEVLSRKSCMKCEYCSFERYSDITIADYWGYKGQGLTYDSAGISQVLINTSKGEKLFNSISNICEFQQLEKEQVKQRNLNTPTEVDINKRNKFWADYKQYGYDYIDKYWIKESIKEKILLDIKYKYKKIKRGLFRK